MLEVTFFLTNLRLPQGDAIAESMVFAFPDKFWDKQRGILGPFQQWTWTGCDWLLSMNDLNETKQGQKMFG